MNEAGAKSVGEAEAGDRLADSGLPTKSIEHGRGALISASSTRRGPSNRSGRPAGEAGTSTRLRKAIGGSASSAKPKVSGVLGQELPGAHGSFLLNAGLVRPLGLEQFENLDGTGA